MDAIILEETSKDPNATWTPNGRDFLVARFKTSQEEVLVSFDKLTKLSCIAFANNPHINPLLAPLGKLLMNAVRD